MESNVQVSEVTAILPLCPFPPLHWWYVALRQHGGPAVIDKNDVFQKQTFRNRILIVGPNGALNVTIPIQGHSRDTLTSEMVLSSHIRPMHSWRSIQTAYGGSPFFDLLKDELADIWFKHLPLDSESERNLGPFSSTCLQWICELCHWTLPPFSESESSVAITREGIDMRRKSHLRGEGWSYERYTQLHEDRLGFISGLSILDALFMLGPSELNQRLGTLVSPKDINSQLNQK